MSKFNEPSEKKNHSQVKDNYPLRSILFFGRVYIMRSRIATSISQPILLLARSFYNLPASTQRDLKYRKRTTISAPNAISNKHSLAKWQ